MDKLVFVTPSIKTGGGNRVFFELANCLIDTFEVEIVYPLNSDGINTFNINDKIKFIPIGKNSLSKIQKIKNIMKTIKYINNVYKNIPIIISDPILCLFLYEIL